MSCTFIALLFVTDGNIYDVYNVYNRAGISISVAICIVFDGENITFHDSLYIYIYIYIYIYSSNSPPIMIMNRMCENHNLLYIYFGN